MSDGFWTAVAIMFSAALTAWLQRRGRRDVLDDAATKYADMIERTDVIKKDVNSGLQATKDELASANKRIAALTGLLAKKQEQLAPTEKK